MDFIFKHNLNVYIPRDEDKIISGYLGFVAICVTHPLWPSSVPRSWSVSDAIFIHLFCENLVWKAMTNSHGEQSTAERNIMEVSLKKLSIDRATNVEIQNSLTVYVHVAKFTNINGTTG